MLFHPYQNKMCEYNLTLPTETEKRQKLLKEVFAEIDVMYTVGQVSEMFDLPVSTLRYYDKEGLFPGLQRMSVYYEIY